LILLLNGCSLIPQPPREVVIKTVEIKTPIKQPLMPSPVDMKEPHWYVVSDKNIEEFQKKIKKETGGVFFAMTPGDYELMAYNLQEIKRFVKETKEVIVYYRTVTLTDEELDVINKSKETTPEKKSFLDTFKRNTDERSESNSGQDNND
tara:strand:+ start:841 stop:1287 length:447 start_codon:yes stop_codon:yes gene_type:complete